MRELHKAKIQIIIIFLFLPALFRRLIKIPKYMCFFCVWNFWKSTVENTLKTQIFLKSLYES